MWLHFSLVVLLCVVIEIQSERTRSGLCNGCMSPGYTRIKRAKYYSSPPQRFYKRPPITYPIRGAFSYTPPPNYMMDDDDVPQPPPSFRSKVSKKPRSEGLGDEDIDNLVKYLSKQDLDRIIEFANEKKRESTNHHKESPFETSDYPNNKPDVNKYESRIINKDATNFNDQKFSLNGPYVSANEDFRPYNLDYSNPNDDFHNSKLSSYPEQSSTALFLNKNQLQSNTQFETEESMQSQRFSFSDAIYPPLSNGDYNNSEAVFTDSRIMQDEQLPKPSNLREDDYDISYTNNVPTVVKSDSDSYKVENFGALPLMNYHSKLDTVDSYRVPHYTVTSPGKHTVPPSSNFNVPVEPAPPVSAAKEQSDAHLKAIKIWTHKSKGTAYTLHDDGSLSLERPSRSKIALDIPRTYR